MSQHAKRYMRAIEQCEYMVEPRGYVCIYMYVLYIPIRVENSCFKVVPKPYTFLYGEFFPRKGTQERL